MIQVVGIDASLSSTGLCTSREGAATVIIPDNPKTARGGGRLFDLYGKLTKYLHTHRPSLALIERNATNLGRKIAPQTLIDLAEWHGVIKYALTEREIPYLMISPSTLKLFACGNGRAEKEDVANGCALHWGAPPWFGSNWDDNMYDALTLAKLGEAVLAAKLGISVSWEIAKYQAQVIKAQQEKEFQ